MGRDLPPAAAQEQHFQRAMQQFEEVKEEPEKKTAPRVIRSYVDPNKVGTKKEDIPDLLWLINANVEHLTPE